MMYLACKTCGEGKTEYELSILSLPYCLKCGSQSFGEAKRPHSFKNWIRHPWLMYKYAKQEKFFDFNIFYPIKDPAEKTELPNQ